MKAYITFVLVIFFYLSGFGQKPQLDFENNPVNGHGSIPLKQNSNSMRMASTQTDFGNVPTVVTNDTYLLSATDHTTGVITDASGNIYMCGDFSGIVNPEGTPEDSGGRQLGFVAKYSSAGELIWWQTISAFASLKITDMEWFAGENFFLISGVERGLIDVGNGIPDELQDYVFYAMVDASDGNVTLTRYFEDTFEPDELDQVKITSDANANKYLMVNMYSPISENNSDQSILIKYDNANNFVFSQYHDETFEDIVVTGEELFVSGTVYPEDDGIFNNGHQISVPSEVSNFAFVAKLNLEALFQWVTTTEHYYATGDQYRGYSQGDQIMVDKYGALYWHVSCYSYLKIGSFESFWSRGALINIATANGSTFVGAEYGNGTPFYNIRDLYIGYNALAHVIGDDNRVYEISLGGGEISPYYAETSMNAPGKLAVTGGEVLALQQYVVAGSNKGSISLEKHGTKGGGQIFSKEVGSDSGTSSIISIETDENGSVYLYGYLSNSLTVMGEAMNAGYFLIKKAPSGDVVWAKNFETTSGNNMFGYGQKLIVDKTSTYIYVVSQFEGEIEIPGEGTITGSANNNFVIQKFGLDGSEEYFILEDFEGHYPSLGTDYNGNLMFSGVFDDTRQIAGTQRTSLGALDAFLIKYDNAGNVLYSYHLGGESSEYSLLTDTDADNSIYLNGEFVSNEIYLNGTKLLEAPEGGANNFIAKINTSNQIEWSKLTLSDHSTDSYEETNTWTTGMKVDLVGNMYIKGTLGSSIYFDNIHLENTDYYLHKFVAKFDNEGNVLWAQPIWFDANSSGYGYDYSEFNIDELGNMYFGFQANGMFSFGESHAYTPTGYRDLVLMKYTSTGQFGWLKAFPSNGTDNNMINSVDVSGTDKIYVGGYFYNDLLVDGVNLSANNIQSGYFLEYEINNNEPSFISTPITTTNNQETYSYEIEVSDSDTQPTLRIYSDVLPAWLSLTDHGDGTATLAGTPATEEDFGHHEISLFATDAIITEPIEQSFTLEAQGTQEITFKLPEVIFTDESPYPLPATSNSPNTIKYQITEGEAEIEDGKLVVDQRGTVVIRAYQEETEKWLAASASDTTLIKGVFSVSASVKGSDDQTLSEGQAIFTDINGNHVKTVTFVDGQFEHGELRENSYYLKVTPTGENAETMLTTYYAQSLQWTAATVLSLTADQNVSMTLLGKTSEGAQNGTGTIAGTIVEQEGAGGVRILQGNAEDGTPVPDVTVYLLDADTDNIVRQAVTDANGKFALTQIATGKYKIYLDIPGVEVSEGSDAVLDFDEEAGNMELTAVVSEEGLAVAVEVIKHEVLYANKQNSELILFPNPATNRLNIHGNRVNYPIRYFIYNSIGQLTDSGTLDHRTGQQNLDISSYKPGIYVLKTEYKKIIWQIKFAKK